MYIENNKVYIEDTISLFVLQEADNILKIIYISPTYENPQQYQLNTNLTLEDMFSLEISPSTQDEINLIPDAIKLELL